jgi:hypothetical protein
MNNLSNEQKLKSLCARIRFIQKRAWELDKGEQRDQIVDLTSNLAEAIQNYFGPKIARDIYWNSEEK